MVRRLPDADVGGGQEALKPEGAARFARAAESRLHTLPALTKQRIYLPVALGRMRIAAEAAGDMLLAAGAARRLSTLWQGADPAFPTHAGLSEFPPLPRRSSERKQQRQDAGPATTRPAPQK